jgi:hypothetical protein
MIKTAFLLAAVMLAGFGARGATTLLYQTGWEAAPASPSWKVGEVAPQNGWINQNSAAGHQVVTNGSQGAIVTPYGNQFHKFTASPDTSQILDRLAWVDITGNFTARPAGQNTIKCSFEAYIPSSQASVPGLYGVAAFHYSATPWGVLLDPSDRSVNIVIDGQYPDYATDAFPYDTWFNVTVTADYATGQIQFSANGVNLSDLTRTSTNMVGKTLTDVDLVAENYSPSAPSVRIAYSDNFNVTATDNVVVRPTLTITPGPGNLWHFSWSASYSNWILESSLNIDALTWSSTGVTPSVSGGVASVNLTNSPPRRFYRLRKP